MLEINRNPSRRELAWFGLALLAFFTILGTVVYARTGSAVVPRVLWLTGIGLTAVYYTVPFVRRPLFVTWNTLTFPLGWLLTRFVLLIVFYVVITPVGLALRVFGRDTMGRRLGKERDSYWESRTQSSDPASYFRQF